METLIAATTALTLLALYFIFSMFRNLKRRRVVRAGGSFAGGVAAGSMGGAGVILLSSLYSYGQLTAEQVIAQIQFTASAPDEYQARLMIDGDVDRLVTLRGDEWQIDARIVTWKPPATILGLDPIYQLDRLSGRYADIDRERNEPRSVHAIYEERTLDLWSLASDYPFLLPGVDAHYGTATYLPMADGARYEVSMSRDALKARPMNAQAEKAVGDWQQDGT